MNQIVKMRPRMTDDTDSQPTPLGIYDKPSGPKVSSIELIAVGLSFIWLVGSVVFFLVLEHNPVALSCSVVESRFQIRQSTAIA